MVRLLLLAPALLVFGSGCLGRAISEAAGVATGARGKVVELQPVPPGKPLGEFGSVLFDPLQSDIDTQVPAGVLENIRARTLAMLNESKLLKTGTRPLKISGRVIHYETGGAVDTAIGPLEEVIARITLADGSTGTVIGEGNVIGRARSTSASGPEKIAEGCAKGIVGWIRKNHPEVKDEKE